MLDAKLWHDLFSLGISPLEKMIRPVLVYVFLVVGLRLGGKRELAQLNAFDLVVLLTLSNTVQNAIIGDDNTVIGGLLGASTLLAVNYLLNRVLYSSPSVDKVLEGSPTVLLRDGVIDQSACQKELVTVAELEAAARRQGFASLDQLQSATLEPGGTITFAGREPSVADRRHQELLDRLDALGARLATLPGGN